MPHRRFHHLAFLAMAALSAVRPAAASPHQTRPGANARKPSSAASAAVSLTLGDMTPLDSGPGAVVGEPIPKDADADTAFFGAGCGRWLNFTLNSRPELGKSPGWNPMVRAERELNKTDCRWTSADAARLASIVGITHAATGEITGTLAHCTLRYTLAEVPSLKPAGAPIVLTGSAREIAAALPSAAHRMLTALGFPNAPTPATAQATAEELEEIGKTPWYGEASDPPSRYARLRPIADHSPLAALILLSGGSFIDIEARRALERRALTLAPDSPVLLLDTRAFMDPEHQAAASALADRYPNNVQLCIIAYELRFKQLDAAASRAAVSRIVRASPHNPYGWRLLTTLISSQSDAIRHARTFGAMTESEQKAVVAFYPLWQKTCERATQTDPMEANLWFDLSQAATFNGDEATADSALWTAIRLDPANTAYYNWGFEIYAPKWFDDKAKLGKIADAAAAPHYPDPWSASIFAGSLQKMGYEAQAHTLMVNLVAYGQKTVSAHPDDPKGHFETAVGLTAQRGKLSDAIAELRTAIRLNPDYFLYYYAAGKFEMYVNDAAAALKDFREAYRLNPAFSANLDALGVLLMETRQWAEAEPIFRAETQRDPTNAMAHYHLALTLKTLGQNKPAIDEYRESIRNGPSGAAFYGLSMTLSDEKRYDEAIAAIKECLKNYDARIAAGEKPTPDDFELLHIALTVAYYGKGDDENAINEARICVKLNNMDQYAYTHLGRALLRAGHKVEARAALEMVVKLNGSNRAYAQSLLDANP